MTAYPAEFSYKLCRGLAFSSLSLHWVVVHPISEESPLYGLSEKDLADCDAEFLVLLTMTEETFSQEIHTRSSYKFHEVVWGGAF